MDNTPTLADEDNLNSSFENTILRQTSTATFSNDVMKHDGGIRRLSINQESNI